MHPSPPDSAPVKRRSNRAYVVVGVLLVGSYLGYQAYARMHQAHALARETEESSIPNVSVVHPTHARPLDSVTLPGNIEAWFQAPIYAQVSGYVKAWYKDYGAVVKKGDLLATINTPTLEAKFAEAKASTDAQKATADLAALYAKRYAAMRASNALSEQAIATKEADARVELANLRASQQNVKNYEALLKFTAIVAPYDGIVISRGINVGDYVNKEGNLSGDGKGSNMFTVADIHRMRLFVSVPEAFGEFLKPGLIADVVVPQFPDRHYKAEFLTVAKGFGSDTRTAITEFTIDNEDHSLWPGSYATVHLQTEVKGNTLTIPSTALVFQENGTQVAVVDKASRVHFKNITVTKILDGTVEVLGGLSLDDDIIDNPSAALLEGDEVHIVKPAPGYKVAEAHESNDKG